MTPQEWNYEDEWFEETNVMKEICRYLMDQKYKEICPVKDKKQHGHDITAIKNEVKIIIEVKGFPSDRYVRGERKGQKKKTRPGLQAKKWYANALLTLLIEKQKNPECRVAMGLPDCEKYQDLIRCTSQNLKKIGIDYFIVNKNYEVEFIDHKGSVT